MTYQETVTPTFRKDWAAAVAAGFEQIRDNRGYRNTPTDDMLEGMARSFERQEHDWLYEQEQLGTYVRVFDSYRDKFRTVPVAEVTAIEEHNEKHKQSEVKTAEYMKEQKAKKKWYHKFPINWPLHTQHLR